LSELFQIKFELNIVIVDEKEHWRTDLAKVVIIGGGIIGSSLAWQLAKAGLSNELIVVEPDPSYEYAATPRAVGGIRFVQGLLENLEMSLYGRTVFENFSENLDIKDDTTDLNFRECGYLFLGAAGSGSGFEKNHKMLTGAGADIELLDQAELKNLLPNFNFNDVEISLYSPRDARIDPDSALHGYRRSALELGVQYKKDKVTGINHNKSKIESVNLESGETISVELVVNAANCWAPGICELVGMKIPVMPVRRQTFFFDMQQEIGFCPAIRDHNGLSFRPDSSGFIAGKTAAGGETGFNWNLNHLEFEQELWPLMARRSKAFEAIKYKGGWVGHYDQNLMDGNPILGHWSGGLSNFIVAAGFSGHGLQHAPAVSLGLSELILHGGFRTFDLSLFSYDRVINNAPISDSGPTP